MAMGFKNPLYESLALAAIAAAPTETDSNEAQYIKVLGGRNIINEALLAATAIKDQTEAFALIEIAKAQARDGSIPTEKANDTFNRAHQLANRFKSDEVRAILLSAIAIAQAEAGLIPNAIATVSIMGEDSSLKASALAAIATAEIEAGRFEEASDALVDAIDITVRATSGAHKTDALIAIAGAQAKLAIQKHKKQVASAKGASIQDAFDTSRKITDNWCKVSSLAAIAIAQIDAGSVQDARDTIHQAVDIVKKNSETPDTLAKISALADIATAQIRAGLFQEGNEIFTKAIVLADEENDDLSKILGLCTIAKAEMAGSEMDGGLTRDAKLVFFRARNIAAHMPNDFDKKIKR